MTTCDDVIRYGPGFAALPRHEQIGLAGHHILHASLRHSARMGAMAARQGPEFQQDLWQIAADAIVNEAILLAGHAVPRPAVTLTGLLAAQDPKARPSPTEALAAWDVDALYLHLDADRAGKGRAARAYAQAQGFAPDLEHDHSTRAGGEGVDQQGPSDAAEWRGHLARAMAAGRSAGFGLGAFGHRLADLPQTRTPWELVLRRLLTRATLTQPRPSTYRPARRWLAADALARETGTPAPGFEFGTSRLAHSPVILVGLDCSGSIPPEALSRLMGEVAAIARRMQGRIELVVFDEAIRHSRLLPSWDWARALRDLDLPRGGGTDFRPVMAHARSARPSALVVLTDLDGPHDPAPPPCPVIWAVSRAGKTPPYGRVLDLGH